MLKTLTATATFALIAAPFALADTQTVPSANFDRIETRGAMNVIYTPGPQASVVIETEGSDFSDADVSVSGGTLTVTRKSIEKRGLFRGSANLRVSDDGRTVRVNGKTVPSYTVRVTSPELSSFKVSQSSWASASGLNASSFEANVSSAGKLALTGRADRAKLTASSSGKIEAEGFEAGALTANASSAGELEVTVSGTAEMDITASSSGEVSVRSLQPAIFSVNASSAGEVELSGACNRISITASSAGEVDAEKLTCETASVNVSSGASVEAFAKTSASGKASSGGSVSFAGKPVQQEASKSSGGSVKFQN